MNPSRFEEAEVEYFYKYLPFNAGALKIITDGTIKFSDPTTFNDPFDCWPRLELDEENLSKAYYKIAKRLGVKPAQRIAERTKREMAMKKHAHDPDLLRRLMRQYGVLSLSKTPTNILMWSHYAQQHQGFVVEFRIPTKPKDKGRVAELLAYDRIHPLEVVYRETRPSICMLAKTQDIDQFMKDMLLTKSLDWKYEEERRSIMVLRGTDGAIRQPGIFPFERNEILVSVIAGMRMLEKDYRELEAAVATINRSEKLNIELFRAEMSPTDYKLHIPGHLRAP